MIRIQAHFRAPRTYHYLHPSKISTGPTYPVRAEHRNTVQTLFSVEYRKSV